jgi:anion-transporting  ArsA/GET3 family ATPase
MIPANYARTDMDVGSFCAQSHVLVVAGKGGVGKTTMAAAIARMASSTGRTVLIVDLEGKSGITGAFGLTEDLGYDEVELQVETPPDRGWVRARRITPDDALVEYLEDHGLRRVSKRLVSSGVVDVVATAIPGIRDVLVLGKVKQLERAGLADLIVVDAPATGHAITFLTSASGLVNAARGGPLRSQAQEVVEMLDDPTRCRVILVTLPEEMPVSETIESAYTLEDKAGIQLGPVIVNACDAVPEGLGETAEEAAAAGSGSGTRTEIDPRHLQALEAARRFRLERHAISADQVTRLARELPLPQLLVPTLAADAIGPAETETLARALAEAIADLAPEPDAPPEPAPDPAADPAADASAAPADPSPQDRAP